MEKIESSRDLSRVQVSKNISTDKKAELRFVQLSKEYGFKQGDFFSFIFTNLTKKDIERLIKKINNLDY